MASALRLPPLDEFRLPLVVPLGHLVLQAAYLENEVYAFIAAMRPEGTETSAEQVAHKLRQWDEKYIHAAIGRAIPDVALGQDLREYMERVKLARDERHRMIHDSMELGLDERSGSLRAIVLREGFVRSSGRTERRLKQVAPEEIAALAVRFYELRIEIDTFSGRWSELGGPRANQTGD